MGPMPWLPALAGMGPALPLGPMPALPQRVGEQKQTPNPFDGMYDDERGMCVAPLAGTGKLPPELASKIPPELWKKINDAGEALANSESPNAAVMSHGVKAKPGGGNFTADHNFHFFSHAYLTASLIKNHGVPPD